MKGQYLCLGILLSVNTLVVYAHEYEEVVWQQPVEQRYSREGCVDEYSCVSSSYQIYDRTTFYYPNDYGSRQWYPASYFGTREAAQARLSEQGVYAEGYGAGCRTAWTGGMYKNPHLIANSYSYQLGWDTGFNKCHYDRSNIDGDKPSYSYIPY